MRRIFVRNFFFPKFQSKQREQNAETNFLWCPFMFSFLNACLFEKSNNAAPASRHGDVDNSHLGKHDAQSRSDRDIHRNL
jgi:hypothetical protein